MTTPGRDDDGPTPPLPPPQTEEPSAEGAVPERADTVESIRRQLLETFYDYHSEIRIQVALLDALIDAARREGPAA